jgi:hypothetical protein
VDNKPGNASKDPAMVIMPGGPRPADQVHRVGPGQLVRRQADGSLAVVRDVENYVLIPGGYRHKSLVHRVAPGQVLRMRDGFVNVIDPSGAVVAQHGPIAASRERVTVVPSSPVLAAAVEGTPPGTLGSGWIATTFWNSPTDKPVTSLRTTWVVPPFPQTQSGQLIYLFNGMQDANWIIQPVLQWGQGPSGGGDYWSVASYYVHSDPGPAFHNDAIRVEPGDVLVGSIALVNQPQPNLVNYVCQFDGISNTTLDVASPDLFWQCVETLEVYSITRCSDYPATLKTKMTSISIVGGGGPATIPWNVNDRVTDCGQHAVVVDPSASNGEVDLYYASESNFPQRTPIAVASDGSNTIDLFLVGDSGGIYTASWQDTGSWIGFNRISDGVFSLMTPVCAIERDSSTIDTFAVGKDGAVYTAWKRNGNWAGWQSIGNGTFNQGTPISATVRDSDKIDLFAVGEDGQVYSAWWRGGNWAGWQSIGNGTFSQATAVAALARDSDKIDMFAVGGDGQVYTAWWRGGNWAGWQTVANGTFNQGTQIAAIARDSGTIDLFAVGQDGGVYTAWWRGSDWSGWTRVGSGVFSPGTTVAATARGYDNIDLFAVGMDGQCYTAWWRNGSGWSDWAPVGSGTFTQTTPIGAVARDLDNIDLFAIGQDGGLYTLWWRGDWSGWAKLDLPLEG